MDLNNLNSMLASILPALTLTFKVALWATFINIVLGIGIAFFLAKKKFIGRQLLDTLFTLPMVMPPTVIGYYLLILLGRKSWLGQWLENTFNINLIFTWQAAVIAAVVVSFPLILKPAIAAFEDIDQQYVKAAASLGINNFAIFIRVILPLAWRGILAGILLAFARALGEFGATLMIAGSIPGKTQTLSIAIYEAVQAGEDQLAHSLVLLISVTCIIILLLVQKLLGKKHAY